MARNFSLISHNMDVLEKDAEARQMLKPAEPFPKEERTKEKTDARVNRAMEDYDFYKETYFPPEMYQDYAKPGKFHKKLFKIGMGKGVHIIAGPREFGKTVEFKILFSWKLLSKRLRIGGTFSHTMPTSSNILNDIRAIIEDNPRIMHDWQVEFQEKNDLQFQFSTSRFKHYCYMAAFSEGRSVRSYGRMFSRPEEVLADDCETKASSMGEEQVKERIDILGETFSSLLKSKALLIILGNNFDKRGFINTLLKQQEQGVLEKHWQVHVFKAWDGKSLWPERYPAKTEEALKLLLKPKDEEDWNGNYQQEPTEEDGDTFPRAQYPHSTYRNLPNDAIGIIWCDPNLAKKKKGDTTAMGGILFSPDEDSFYIFRPRCLSFSDSNKLLDAYVTIIEVSRGRIRRQGFDGHVNQESNWSNNVRNYQKIKGIAVPKIQYGHYNVEDLAKNAQLLYLAGQIKFPEDFATSKEGEVALKQMFAFKGKKVSGVTDDFPDFIICGIQFIYDQKLVRKKSRLQDLKVTIIQEPELQ